MSELGSICSGVFTIRAFVLLPTLSRSMPKGGIKTEKIGMSNLPVTQELRKNC